jgi:hypothetical protein
MADPCYPCNRHFVSAFDGVPVTIPVGPHNRFQLDAATVDAHWTDDVRGVLLATPSNPTGTSIAFERTGPPGRRGAARGGFTLVDEIYLDLSLRRQPRSAVSLGDDVLVAGSFSKFFHMTGWRLGWLVVPPALVSTFEKLAQNLFICPSALAQHAALACFEPEAMAVYRSGATSSRPGATSSCRRCASWASASRSNPTAPSTSTWTAARSAPTARAGGRHAGTGRRGHGARRRLRPATNRSATCACRTPPAMPQLHEAVDRLRRAGCPRQAYGLRRVRRPVWRAPGARADLGRPQVGGGLVEHAVDVLVAVGAAEALGHFDRFVDDHAVGHLDAVRQLVGADQQHTMFHRRQQRGAAVDMARQHGVQRRGFGDAAVQQGVEVGRVALGEVVLFAHVGVDHRRLRPTPATGTGPAAQIRASGGATTGPPACAGRLRLGVGLGGFRTFVAHPISSSRLAISTATRAASGPFLRRGPRPGLRSRP